MSQWTHVNGNIRFDSLIHSATSFPDTEKSRKEKAENIDAINLMFKREIVAVMGEIKTYDHVGLFGEDSENCPTSNIPCGSEGSIKYSIHIAPRGFNIVIWGDLRSYDEGEARSEIIPWFGKIMNYSFSIPVNVRDAVLHISVEYGVNIILIHDYENKRRFTEHTIKNKGGDMCEI